MMKKGGFDIVIGTRPDVIKFAPLILEMDKQNIPFHIYHELQHTDYNMFDGFLEEFNLMKFFDEGNYFEHVYSNVLIYGDTDGAFRQAYQCKRDKMNLIHVEAGLRCYDEFMYEEINRTLIDHISNHFFAPTVDALNNLEDEKVTSNFPYSKVLTGNLINDVLEMIDTPDIKTNGSILVTIHRRENIYNPLFLNILKAIADLQKEYTIVFPLHPHTQIIWGERIKALGIPIQPAMDYMTFIQCVKDASLIITDSGGVSEEACILKKKCIVLRNCTERPETLIRNVLLCKGHDYNNFINCFKFREEEDLVDYDNPYKSPNNNETVAQTMCNVLRSIL